MEFNSDKMAETYEILGMDNGDNLEQYMENTSQDFEKVERSWRRE